MKKLAHKFVEFIPDVLEDGVIYVSPRFALVSHRCCCGCGEEVVLKLSPTDWHLVFDGETISLHPSIGNWGLKCRSHYWITKSRVHWASPYTGAKTHAAWHGRDQLNAMPALANEAMQGPDGAPISGRLKAFLRRFWAKLQKRWQRK